MSVLENNTTELQAILDAVNALPEAEGSGGASLTNSTVTVTHPDGDVCIQGTHVNSDGEIAEQYTFSSMGSFTALKGSVIFLYEPEWKIVFGNVTASGAEVLTVESNFGIATVRITDDVATINITA